MDNRVVGAAVTGAALLGAAIAVHMAAPAGHTGSAALIEPAESVAPPVIVHVGAGALVEPAESVRPPRR